MATRLFYYQFFGDLGKRFLTAILAKIIEEFSGLDHTVEIDAGRVHGMKGVDPNANLMWILQRLDEFVGSLQDSADHCPLGLRESFLFLKDVVGNKVENSNVFIASVLFLRLICPCLVSPEEYSILDSLGITLTDHAKRGLVIASKILQSAANNSMWENRPGSEQVNEFIARSNPLIVTFASRLIDAETISLGKKVIKASVTPVSSSEVKQTYESMQHFLGHFILKKELKREVDYQQKYQMAMNFYNSKDWKIMMSGPKKDDCEYHVSHLPQEGSSIIVSRYWGRFKAPFELTKDLIRTTNPEMTTDDRVTGNDIIEHHSAQSYDGYLTIKAVFPVSARDFVFTRRHFDETPNKWIQVTYSVDREDKPIDKKFVRGSIDLLLSVIERDPADPDCVLYTYIYRVDLKGWIPAFVYSNASKDNLQTLSKVASKIMNLGKDPSTVQEDKKQKKDKKLKKDKTTG